MNKYGTLSPSYAECNKNDISIIGKICLKLFSIFKIIHVEEKADNLIKCNNLTLINLCLLFTGPINEKTLTTILLFIQVSYNLDWYYYVFLYNYNFFFFSLFAVYWHLLYATHWHHYFMMFSSLFLQKF